jgi:RNA polymerase sigma factor (sigma-70 family)
MKHVMTRGGTGCGRVAAAGGTAGDAPPGVVSVDPRSRVCTADAGSFEDVYRASYARLVRTARMLTGSSETAEEVVQDAFVGLHPHFDTVHDPIGYLYRSVVNGCRTGHRRRQVRERLRPSPARSTVDAPEIDETWAALRSLPIRRRTVIVLRYYADLPIADIAQILGCPAGTVRSLLHRSLSELEGLIGR